MININKKTIDNFINSKYMGLLYSEPQYYMAFYALEKQFGWMKQ